MKLKNLEQREFESMKKGVQDMLLILDQMRGKLSKSEKHYGRKNHLAEAIQDKEMEQRFERKMLELQEISGQRIPRCVICGTSDLRVLTINHLGDKNDHKNCDVRCINCNWIYEFERGRQSFNAPSLEKHFKQKRIIAKDDRLN
jgi:hypothetical protein